MDHNQLTIKTYMAIMAERDAAIRERNMALDERKRAFAERDMAMLQRDAAIAERNSAVGERDKAIAALRFWDSSMKENNMTPDSSGNGHIHHQQQMHHGEKHIHHQQQMHHGEKHIHHQQQMHHMPHFLEDAQYSREDAEYSRGDPPSDSFPITGVASQTAKTRKAKQTKEAKAVPAKKSAKSAGKGRKGSEASNKQIVATSNAWKNEDDLGGDEEDLDGQLVVWKEELGFNQVDFDESTMPVPVCSCTGAPQPCYKWGNGGWQSACCTTTMSMYPLPQVSNKRYSRVGGRKMSGSAFTKLLNRIAAEGHDLSTPVDLKDHWSRHGTNRYSSQK